MPSLWMTLSAPCLQSLCLFQTLPLVSHFPGHLLTNLTDIGKPFGCWRKGLILKAEYLVPSPTWTNCCCSLSLEFSLWEKRCWLHSYVGQEARVRTGHGTTDWFQIGKGVCQGCILLPCLFNLYAEDIMWNSGWSRSWNQDCQEKYQ